MLLYAGILLHPGDMLELEFNTHLIPDDSRRALPKRLLFRVGICGSHHCLTLMRT